MYLKFNKISKESLKKVEKLLKEENVSYKKIDNFEAYVIGLDIQNVLELEGYDEKLTEKEQETICEELVYAVSDYDNSEYNEYIAELLENTLGPVDNKEL